MATNYRSARKVLEKYVGRPTFGMFVRAMRTLHDKTQVEMAEFLEITKSSLCDIEKGRHIVSIDMAIKIAKKCGYPEELAVKRALDDQLYRSGLDFEVELKKKSKRSA